jgi:hypothetical protein
MRALFTFLVLVVFCSSANAQLGYQVKTKNLADTVLRSIQCEIGLFAVKAKGYGLDPGLKAHLKWSTTITNENNPNGGISLGGLLAQVIQTPSIKAGYDLTKIDGGGIEGKLNINQGNTQVCVKGQPAIALGIYDCLTTYASSIKAGFTATCKKQLNAKATFDASGKFSFWVVTVGPDWSIGKTAVYEMDVDAPAADTPTGAPKTDKTAQN